MFGNERILTIGKTLQQSDNALMCVRIPLDARISQRYTGIANDAAPFRSLHRTVAKYLAEFLLR